MITSKRILIPLTLLLVVVMLTISSTYAQGPKIPADLPDLKGREVVVVTAQDYYPLTYVDEKGKAAGMEYEIWGEICKRLNCKLTWKVAAWDGMLTAMKQK